MRTRFRPLWILVVAVILVTSSQAAAPPAEANDLQQQLEQAQRDLEAARQRQSEVQNALADVTFQAQEAEAQLRLVESELVQANSQLAVITEEFDAVTTELEQVEAEVADAEARYEAKRDVLGTRIRAVRESGRVDQVAVLFGATSFRDFISRMEVLSMIVKKDRELVQVVEAEKQELEAKKEEVTVRKNRLSVLKSEAESYQATVAAKRLEREQVSRSLDESRRSLQAQLDEYDAHTNYLAEQIAAIVREMNRQGGVFAPTPPVTPVLITDYFGMRDHPILGGQRMHYGTDFNAYMGQPVHAIADGVVISTSYDDVFGNLVIIDHGGGITSWYAHNSSIVVSPNQVVSQGEHISNAGSTGWSTGPHVHLELHIDGERVNVLDYLNW